MMQTFLPYKDYLNSALKLDNTRLFKQCVECKEILAVNSLDLEKYKSENDGKLPAWYNHPAVKMWRGYESNLCTYALYMCNEAINRDIDAYSLRNYFLSMLETFPKTGEPPWLGNERLHSSHRANLLRKDFEFYSKYGWRDFPGKSYYWPV